MNLCIVINTRFEAIHSWPECPIEEVYFLRYPHRHVFHVTLKWKVEHENRSIEFIQKKHEVEAYIARAYGSHIGSRSCEMIARELLQALQADFVSVFEDGENGAEVTTL